MARTLFGRRVVGCLSFLWCAAMLPAAPEVERLYDTEYVAAETIAPRSGLSDSWLVPQRRLLLSDRDTRIELEVDSRDLVFDGVRVFMGEPAVLNRRSLYVSRIDRDRLLRPILEPRSVPGPVPSLRLIVIDPGHGGKDDGAINAKLKMREKAMALDVALRLEKLLKAAGYKVLLTRRKDSFIPLPLRPAHANKVKADLFISIHFNALENRTVAGTETYILTPQHQRSTSSEKRMPDDKIRYPGNGDDAWNAVLGFHVHRNMLRALRTNDRGLKRARFAVLRDLECPGLLVEGGYLSNEAEARKIGSPDWRQQLAKAIAAGVDDYRTALAGARK